MMGYQIPRRPEWSNEMQGWTAPGFSHARICFVMHFLLGNLSFEMSPDLQRTIFLMVKGQDFPSTHEGLERSIYSV